MPSLSRITDVFFAIPLLLAAIVFMQMFRNRSIAMVVIVLSTFSVDVHRAVTRGSVMSAKNEEFVTPHAPPSRGRILMSTSSPNSMAPSSLYATVAGHLHRVRASCPSWVSACRPTIVSWDCRHLNGQRPAERRPMVLFYPAVALALTVSASS